MILAFMMFNIYVLFFLHRMRCQSPKTLNCVFGLHMCWRSLCTDVYEGSLWTLTSMAFSGYGLSPLRIIPAVRETVKKFDRIYELQEPAERLREEMDGM